MSNNKPMAQQAQPRVENNSDLRAEIDSLKQKFSELALMVLPGNLRNRCACGALACQTVTGVRPGSTTYGTHKVHLCEDCTLPPELAFVSSVSLDPTQRETVRLANSVLGKSKPRA